MGNFIIYVVLMKIKISLQQKLKSRDSFIQLKPMLDIFLRGFSLLSVRQHSLKVLLLLNLRCLFKVRTELWIEFFIFRFG
jgi:hypothetical protein